MTIANESNQIKLEVVVKLDGMVLWLRQYKPERTYKMGDILTQNEKQYKISTAGVIKQRDGIVSLEYTCQPVE